MDGLKTILPVSYSKLRRMTLEELRSRYRDQIVAAAGRRGTHNVRIFGPAARGDQRNDSDIDFLRRIGS
jgi:predicted nucleotidyltransferase